MKKLFLAAAAVLAFAAAAGAATVNPFSDVPASHWAHDAVSSLASRGIVSGMADGTYKGARPTTRYEMASAIARALATFDRELASKSDVDMMKRLVIEFKDELDALGVKVDALDGRAARLEQDLGGWSISGQLRFDAKFSQNGSGVHGEVYPLIGKNQFDLDRYRMYIRKRINATTSFTTRLGANTPGNDMVWEEYYIKTKLGENTSLLVGRAYFDWEDETGFYVDDDAYFSDVAINHLRLTHEWSRATLDIVIGRLNDNTGLPTGFGYDEFENTVHGTAPEEFEQILIAAKLDYQFNERLRAGLMYYGQHSDHDEKTYPNGVELDACLNTYGAYVGYSFTPDIELKGIYYRQDLAEYYCDVKQIIENGEDARFKRYANFWRAILDVKQDALKYTSLWLEYGQMDNNFTRLGRPAPTGDMGADLLGNAPFNTETTRFFGVRADQEWNDTWRTFVKYWKFDYDTAGMDDAKLWALGVGYRLNPAVEFELAYEKVDYGKSWAGNPGVDTDDSIVRLRTFVTF